MDRYDRQIRVKHIGPEGQEKFLQATVLIVGCGALGTYTAEQCLRAGIKHLTLVDFDTIEESNLQRQTLFTQADAQEKWLKVTTAKARLLEIDPTAEITAVAATFEEFLLTDHLRPQLVLDCTDNYQVRKQINDYCRQYRLPFVFAACAGTSGQLMAIDPSKGPCLGCALPQLEELMAKDCDLIGVATPLIPFISSQQVILAMKILTAPQHVDWGQMLIVDVWHLSMEKFGVAKQSHCRFCSDVPAVTTSATVKKLCGADTYQTMLPPVDFCQLAAYCQQQQWPYQQNALAFQIQLTPQKITIFKDGRTNFHAFGSREALAPYLENLLERKEA